MGVKIKITNSIVTDEGKLLNGMSLKGNPEADITLDSLHLYGKGSVLENIELVELMDRVSEEIMEMNPDTREYQELRRMLQESLEQRELKTRIMDHIADFSQGVLANLISGWMLR